MLSLNSYICPKCGNPFPFFIKLSMRIRRGLLQPYLKCPNCGQISKQKIDFYSAIWIWPLTVASFAALIYVLRNFLYRKFPVLYILIVIVLFAPFFIALRRGSKLHPIEETQALQHGKHKWIIPISVIVICGFLLGYLTQDWVNVAIGIVIGLIVWALYYYFSAKK